jgi:hypothetical protein
MRHHSAMEGSRFFFFFFSFLLTAHGELALTVPRAAKQDEASGPMVRDRGRIYDDGGGEGIGSHEIATQ